MQPRSALLRLVLLASLFAAACGGAPPRQEPTVVTTTSSSSLEGEGAGRTNDELARDPAWESIPPSDGAHSTRDTHEGEVVLDTHEGEVVLDTDESEVVLDTHEGEVAPAPCTGACTEGDHCTDARGWSCACTRHTDLVCGGAYRMPNPPYLAWECAPSDPNADRGDGCPFREPQEGARCTGSEACHYAHGCGYSGVDATCVSRRWSLQRWAVPPPP